MKTTYQDWMLTAYALGELDPADIAVVEDALKATPALTAELLAIKQTIVRLDEAYQANPHQTLSTEQVNKLRASIASDAHPRTTSVERPQTSTGHQKLWIALTSLAACFIAALFALPNYFERSPQVGLKVDSVEPIAARRTSSVEIAAAVADQPASEGLERTVELESRSNLADTRTSSRDIVADESVDAKNLPAAAKPKQTLGRSLQEIRGGTELSYRLDQVETKKIRTMPEEYDFAEVPMSGEIDAAEPLSGPQVYYGPTADLDVQFKQDSFSGKREEAQSGERKKSSRNLEVSEQIAAKDFALSDGVWKESDQYDEALVAGLSNRRYIEPRPALESNAGDRFEKIEENTFQKVATDPVTTFSIDVDTAAYSKIRQSIVEANRLPNPNAVRIEEMINYFDYNYAGPTDDVPFGAALAAADCPWNADHKLVRIALQAKKIEADKRPLSNLVFLLDVSGSMSEPNKLPLLKKSITMLVRQLGENDRVAIVVYAGAAGIVLPSVPANRQNEIMTALDELAAGGSTNGGEGIELAYKIAKQNFIRGGVNRILLCTDGDFNVGNTGDQSLEQMVQQNAKDSQVYLTCLGFGMGNYNDSMMEKITNGGNGTYAMIDTELEAKKVMVEQINGTLITVAKDVKIQVEFNPQHVQAYRLIGYENRKLANRDFNDDTKDAGEIGAGHRVTALYEIVPVGSPVQSDAPEQDNLRYAAPGKEVEPAEKEAAEVEAAEQVPAKFSDELLNVKLRYKLPDADVSTKLEFPLQRSAYESATDADFRWASSVAQFGMLLRGSSNSKSIRWSELIGYATTAAGNDNYRLEAVDLMRRASQLIDQR